jgi:hypothetical protein
VTRTAAVVPAARLEPRLTPAAVAAMLAGTAVLGLVTAGCVAAWRDSSPLVPLNGGVRDGGAARWFLGLLVAAFVLYLAGLALLVTARLRLVATLTVAAAIQLAPLGAPLLLSTDAWTYWDYGRIAAIHGGNPYDQRPSAYSNDPAYDAMGARWRDRRSVYGPAFTLASEPIAHAAGSSRDAAAWMYKTIAGLSALGAAALAAAVARQRAIAAAFVGWNPVLAVHLAGGGHNDAWVGALMLAALALALARRRMVAGGAWVLAIGIKWVPIAFLALRVLEARARRERVGILGLVVSAAAVAALALWRYGPAWLSALGPLADNAQLETRYALPHRLHELGVPRTATLVLAGLVATAGAILLVRAALAGRARLALGACLVLVTTPYLAVWYLGWAVPLAAADDNDLPARLAVLGLCAYLLPQTIPL